MNGRRFGLHPRVHTQEAGQGTNVTVELADLRAKVTFLTDTLADRTRQRDALRESLQANARAHESTRRTWRAQMEAADRQAADANRRADVLASALRNVLADHPNDQVEAAARTVAVRVLRDEGVAA